MKNIIFYATILMLGIGVNLQAQTKFKPLISKENVDFSYRWKPEKDIKDGPLVLVIKMSNSNAYKVQVKFKVDYYYKTIRSASSEEQVFCVSSEESIIGKVKKQTFDKGSLTNEQLLSDDFIIELSDIVITKSEKCTLKK